MYLHDYNNTAKIELYNCIGKTGRMCVCGENWRRTKLDPHLPLEEVSRYCIELKKKHNDKYQGSWLNELTTDPLGK
jgi:hypothetical protein